MNKIMLNAKSFRESAGMCGPASLKIVLDYYGVKKTERELALLCDSTRELGTSNEGIVRAAKKLGFKVALKNNSSFLDIERWLKKGVPVIVDWFTRGRKDYSDGDIADGHYSVVTGLDKTHIYLQDPELGRVRKIKKEDFLIVWFDFKGRYIKPKELIIRQLIAIYK